ncbi:MAG: 16S rRNA (adenine(1518)-N(6)/adenine(1519)-N(6))-dimethyltransferase RsmA [Ruminococcaceae bacterium]|nr:16S rRNA (adenine(1518)-N(6)/adenine(1519)-N(6))-dimethyltransferase RsmA [Oscillospiraceae bacterium]
MDLCNPSVIKSLLGDEGTHLRKEYGQNFLIRREIPERIAEECTENEDSMILEIGPGIGCLTKELAERYGKVVSVEIDSHLLPILAKTLEEYDNVTVINQDVMKVDLQALVDEHSEGREVSVCANLPYYITTPILMALLESGVPFRSITVMVQAEVAQRLCAKAGDDTYGAITAVLGYYGETRRLFTVPASAFLPAPKVNSAVVRIDLYKEPRYLPKDKKLFFALIKAAFEMRRKTLVNAISAKLPYTKEEVANALASIGLSDKIRGERLSTADFASLADALLELK